MSDIPRGEIGVDVACRPSISAVMHAFHSDVSWPNLNGCENAEAAA